MMPVTNPICFCNSALCGHQETVPECSHGTPGNANVLNPQNHPQRRPPPDLQEYPFYSARGRNENQSPVPYQKTPVSGLSPRHSACVLRFIADHRSENIQLGILAELVGLSPYYFARQFKEAFGQSPHEFQLRCRIEAACATLRTQPEAVLANVAVSFGFADESHFRRHFKRILGITPGRYRQLFQK